MDLNVHLWRFQQHIIGPQCPYGTIEIPCGGTAAAATAAATTAVSQELWNIGGALFQRAQEPNIPCGESLTSMDCQSVHFLHQSIDFQFFSGMILYSRVIPA